MGSSLVFDTRTLTQRSRAGALHVLHEQGLLPVRPLPGAAPRVALTSRSQADVVPKKTYLISG